MSDAPAPRPTSWRPPLATAALALAMLLIFIAQQLVHVGPRNGLLGTNAIAATALGALDQPSLADGQWWRMLTAAFLHADALHLLFNGVAFLLGAIFVEQLLGTAWLLALFFAGALGGSAASAALNPPDVVSLGASGAILALLVAGLISTARLPAGAQRNRVRLVLAQVSLPALIPIALVREDGNVDFAAHLGGAVVGALLGGAVVAAWTARRQKPPARAFAALVAALGIAGTLYGFATVARTYRPVMASAALYDALMTDEQAEALRSATIDDAEQAVREWPDDPRAHYVFAHALLGAQDHQAAIDAATRGLALGDTFRVAFPDGGLEAALRVVRALAAIDGGIARVAPDDIATLCGPLAETEGGAWARENDLCETRDDDAPAPGR